jgi:hypothetical protein
MLGEEVGEEGKVLGEEVGEGDWGMRRGLEEEEEEEGVPGGLIRGVYSKQ